MFEYRFTNCSYHEHGAGNISNPSKSDDIIHYSHFFLTFDGDNVNTRDFLFLSSVTACYNSSTRTFALWRHVHRQAGANIVQTQNCVFGRFSNFFIRMRPGPTHPLPIFFLDFWNFAKPLSSCFRFWFSVNLSAQMNYFIY